MAEDKGFLDRWSKRKRAARDAARQPENEPAHEPDQSTPPEQPPEPIAAAEEPEIDPAALPPIDGITSGADVQAFLRKGVPKALRQAALRRLWSADPKIRDFREVADYDWDFNAPGYGALLPADDPKAAAEKLFAAMRRRVAERGAPAPAEPEASRRAVTTRAASASPAPEATATAAAEPEAAPTVPEPAAAAPDPAPPPRRRRHGSAVPS